MLTNEDTLLRTHCCRHKCFPVCPRAQHLLRTQILCPGHRNVSDFVQKHYVSATNVSQFAQPKKHHGQQCVRNNVSSFARAFSLKSFYIRNLLNLVWEVVIQLLQPWFHGPSGTSPPRNSQTTSRGFYTKLQPIWMFYMIYSMLREKKTGISTEYNNFF